MRHVRRFPRAIGVAGTLVAMAVGLPAGVAGAGMAGIVDPGGPLGSIAGVLPGAHRSDEPSVQVAADARSEEPRADRRASAAPGPVAIVDPTVSPSPEPTATESPDPLAPLPEASADAANPGGAEAGSTPTAAPKNPAPRTDALTTARNAVLDFTNAERAKAGCGPVHLDDRINAAAQRHSEDMNANNYFSHTSLDGSSFVTRLQAQGYARPRSENIARGQQSAEEVVTAWMNSSGHRANILDCSAQAMGLGLSNYYWTQNFGLE